MRRTLAVLSVCLAALVAPYAHATCTPGQSPFNDVADGDIFCGSALWLRNAVVTTGCQDGSVYCPNDAVTRAQMALFMKRLARAVTPDILFANTPSVPGSLDGSGFATCVTGNYAIPAGANPRLLSHAAGTVSLLTDGPAQVDVMIQASINGGVFGSFPNPPRATVPGNQWTVVPVLAGQTIVDGQGATVLMPGATYQFRILVRRSLQTADMGEVTDNHCQLTIHLPVDAAS